MHRILVILAAITLSSIAWVGSSRADFVTLAWSAPGEDSLFGRASRYDLRYSAQMITPENFLQANAAPGVPLPAQPGVTQTYLLAGLPAGVVCYLAIKTADLDGNWSAMSNVIARMPIPGLVPTAVALLSPSDGATGVATAPMLIWQPSPGATSYRLQVALKSDFVAPQVDVDGLTATGFQVGALENGATYYWRVQASGTGGPGPWSSLRHFRTASASPTADVPGAVLSFSAPLPNPARVVTRFVWAMPAAANLSIQVFDLSGRRVRVLQEGDHGAGPGALEWDLRDNGGNPLSGGIYLVRARLGEATFIRRVVIAR